MAANAARLCGVDDVTIHRVEDGGLRRIAHVGAVPVLADSRLPLLPGGVNERVLSEGRTVHIPDTHAPSFVGQFPGSQHAAMGIRSLLATPLVRDGVAIGLIQLRRSDPRAFTGKQIALLETFANQAVIAIENVRLFRELQARNAELTESLEQQTATAQILRVISSSPSDLQPVMEAVAENAARVCGAMDSSIFRLEGEHLRLVARHGSLPRTPLAIGDTIPVSTGSLGGRVVGDRRTIHLVDILAAEAEFPETVSRLRQGGSLARTTLATPLLREGTPLGVIMITRGPAVHPFSAKQIALLETFANQAVIAIENVRLFNETKEALEQQTATAEILRVISSSPTDVQPVFEAVAENAARVCGAMDSSIFRLEGEHLRLVARHGSLPRPLVIGDALPVSRGYVSGRAVCDGRTIHVADIMAAEADFPEAVSGNRRAGSLNRTMVATPLLREGTPLGVIMITRGPAVQPFSAKQIALLETFADQAVIAIENVRLFNELEARNRDLTEALKQQTATSEILRVISQSPTDVQPVFDTIAQRAVSLCDAEFGSVSRFDGTLLQSAALHGVTREGVEAVRAVFPMRLDAETMAARAFRARAVIHVEDVLADPRYQVKDTALAAGWRAALAVPMLRGSEVIGTIFVGRSTAGRFTDPQIELLKTFADQAVIAIENVRLFTELEARNRELTESLEQQTATGEILRVIASSPTELQPVMDTVAENAARVCGATESSVWRLEGEHLRLVARRGSRRRAIVIGESVRVSRGWVSGRAVIDRRTIHVEDLMAAEAEFPEAVSSNRQVGSQNRTMLATPLLARGRRWAPHDSREELPPPRTGRAATPRRARGCRWAPSRSAGRNSGFSQ